MGTGICIIATIVSVVYYSIKYPIIAMALGILVMTGLALIVAYRIGYAVFGDDETSDDYNH
jgi:hypothetical protein